MVFATRPSGGSTTTAVTIDSSQNTTFAGNVIGSGTANYFGGSADGEGVLNLISTSAGNETMALECINDSETAGTATAIAFQTWSGSHTAKIVAKLNAAAGAKTDMFFHLHDGSNANARVTFLHSGKVGIGTAAPSELLEIASSGDVKIRFLETDVSDSYIILHISEDWFGLSSSGSAHDLGINTATGNVGIGESSPSGLLHIKNAEASVTSYSSLGTVKIEDTANAGIEFVVADDKDGFIGTTSPSGVFRNYVKIGGNSSDDITLVTDGGTGTLILNQAGKVITQDSIYLDTTGKGLFCNTDDGSDNEQLYVGGGGDGDSGRGAIIRLSGNDGGNAGLMYFEAGNVTGGNIKMYVGGAEKFRVEKSSGDIYSNDGSVSSLSDLRVKKNVSKISYGLAEINLLNPVNYKFNGVAWTEEDEVERIGFIYQELVKVLPIATNKTLEEGTEYGTIAQTKLIPILVKAVQELSAKVEALENA
jgi:hypothetical protein